MSESRWFPSNTLSVKIYNNLELAKEAVHAYASNNEFSIAVQRSTEWGYPPCVRKVWIDVYREDTIASGHLEYQIIDKGQQNEWAVLTCISFFQRKNSVP